MSPTSSRTTPTALFAGMALVSFSLNSILCRMALGPRSVDAATFTTVRLVSGAATLWLLAAAAGRRNPWRDGTWAGAAALFSYAIAFSYAYRRLPAGTGALILFASVQITMIGWGLLRGERPRSIEWAGFVIALAGSVVLTRPGLAAPPAVAAALMAIAGASWGIYSLLGRRARSPLHATAGNFARTVPLALASSAVFLAEKRLSARGVALAAASGSITSGVGYSFWYAALPGLTAMRAAILQLAVPILAAALGVLVLQETVTPRLIGSGAAILGGILLAILGRARAR